MPTRKAFIGAAAGAAAGIANLALNGAALASGAKASSAPIKPSPAPKPRASPPPRPSKLARELAASLQHDLPRAHVSNAMTEKIASDIQDNFAINKAFRTRSNRNLPPPDFVFTVSDETRP